MKSTTDLHREALDQALRVALGTSQPALRKQALARAASHLIHPKLVLESPLLTDSHRWRHDALVVADAFEAVTNGMEEPGVLEALEDLDPESPFEPWRHLILAIHFFYGGLDEAVMAHLGQIPLDSPLQTLVKTLAGVTQGTQRFSPAQRRLADLLAQPDPVVQQWVQDVAEGLESGDEDLFWAALTDWLEHMVPQAPDRAQAAVLWAWNQLEWRDFDEQVLLDLGSSLWGRGESYRLAALGTRPWDAEGAALLWSRFLLTGIREGLDEVILREGRQFLDLFRAAAETSPPSPEGRETWTNLCGAWNAEVRARGWDDLRMDLFDSPEPVVAPRPAPTTDGQLDLFS